MALKKLEQEQKEVALRIAQIEESIRKIELQRAQNTKEQNEALAKLEEEKKPILERRNDAKAAADLCDRELSGVERRLQENDAADRDLLKKLTELQAQIPPPADLEAQMAAINARRIRLPEERAEVTRARLGQRRSVPDRPGETGPVRTRNLRSWTRTSRGSGMNLKRAIAS